MKLSIETFVNVIVITLMAIISTCYITASLNTRNAQNFHSSMVTEIEASHFSASVIEECKQKAIENGYTGTSEDGHSISGLEVVPVQVGDGGKEVAEVTLTYDYTIPFLNVFLEHEIVGYAR